MKRVAGLNIHSFNPIEAFMEVFSHYIALAKSAYYLERGAYIHGITFVILLKTVKTCPANLSPFTVEFRLHLSY